MGRNQTKRLSALGAILVLGMLASTGNASTDGIEKWECGDYAIILTADFNTEIGTIKLGNMKAEPATANTEGLNRRWSWGSKKENTAYAYSLIIEPTGSGLYYDFRESERAIPSDHFICSQLELKQSEIHNLENQQREQQESLADLMELGIEAMEGLATLKNQLGSECYNAMRTVMFTLEDNTHIMEENCTDAEQQRIEIWTISLAENWADKLNE